MKKVSPPCMHYEVSYRHLSGQNEGDRARKQAKEPQQTCDEFEHPGNAV